MVVRRGVKGVRSSVAVYQPGYWFVPRLLWSCGAPICRMLSVLSPV